MPAALQEPPPSFREQRELHRKVIGRHLRGLRHELPGMLRACRTDSDHPMLKTVARAQTWGHGLVGAVLGGVANAVILLLADPVSFNLETGWKRLVLASLASGLLSGAFYVKRSPLQ